MDTWTRGGCGLLADAIRRWLPTARRFSVVCLRDGARAHVCHVIIRYDGIWVDGAGAEKTARPFLDEVHAKHAENDDAGWVAGDEELPTQQVWPWVEGTDRSEVEGYPDQAALQLAAALRRRFGDHPKFSTRRVRAQ